MQEAQKGACSTISASQPLLLIFDQSESDWMQLWLNSISNTLMCCSLCFDSFTDVIGASLMSLKDKAIFNNIERRQRTAVELISYEFMDIRMLYGTTQVLELLSTLGPIEPIIYSHQKGTR